VRRRLWLALGLLLSVQAGSVSAHKPSSSYLQLQVDEQRLSGRWDLGIEDLDLALRLDSDGDGVLRWRDLLAREADIAAYALSRIAVNRADTRCTLRAGDLMLVDLSDGTYASLPLTGDCPAAEGPVELRYGLLFDLDPQHRGLLQLRRDEGVQTGVFAPDRRVLSFGAGPPDAAGAFRQYFREGVFHIAIGLDHLLFLAGLLLPAVAWRSGRGWAVSPDARSAFFSVAKVVTAFTVAHAIALTLASLGLVRLPTRLTESLVAATIIFAALNNLYPVVLRRLWMVAFGFGLIHGAGYASVLGDLGLSAWTLFAALLAFNLGVEGMQIAVSAVVVPLAFLVRHQSWYRWGIVSGGSLLVAALGSVWLIERAFNLRFG
jgi:hypothetical protein